MGLEAVGCDGFGLTRRIDDVSSPNNREGRRRNEGRVRRDGLVCGIQGRSCGRHNGQVRGVGRGQGRWGWGRNVPDLRAHAERRRYEQGLRASGAPAQKGEHLRMTADEEA